MPTKCLFVRYLNYAKEKYIQSVPSIEITLELLHLWKFKLASDEQQQKRVLL